MNVVLIGMKHCGKSTIGRGLAERMGCPFFDVDSMIQEMHQCDTGRDQSVREIFAEFGEEYFHQVEGAVVCDLYLKLNQPESEAVVALGGRTAMNEAVTELLGGIGLVTYLHVPRDELFARVRRSGLPPFLDEADPQADFEALCRKREPQYRRLADTVVDLSHLSVDEAVSAVLRSIREHRNGR